MKTSKFQNHEESTGLLFWQASMLWQRKIKEALQSYNLTHTQFVILAVIEELCEQKVYATQKKISDFSMIDVMTISSTVRLMEKKGLLCRVAHQTDTRAKSLTNTKSGKETLIKAVKKIECIDENFFFDDKQKNSEFHNSLFKLIEKNNPPLK